MRVLVCGSRGFGGDSSDINIMNSVLTRLVPTGSTIVHGGCRGADVLAGQWARKNGFVEVVYHADWKTHGKSAGPIRNSQMIHSDIDLVVAFWDGKSSGTLDTITKAKKSYIGEDNVHVVEYS